MIASISGATGFIASSLIKKLREKGWEVKTIDRESFRLPDPVFAASLIEGTDAVINLAGAPLSRKWTPAYKQELLDSRILTTRKIVNAIQSVPTKPEIFLSSSAIGIYDSVQSHTESSQAYTGSFLSELCRKWETEALAATGCTRVAVLRTGLVLGRNGGALEKMYYPFRIGLGAKIGNGRQPVSFIHIDDLTGAIIRILEDRTLQGAINAVSPIPTTNREFTTILGKVLGQPAVLTIPSFLIRMIYGEGSVILLEGQKVLPEKLEKAGFRFQYPTIQNSLVRVYKYG
jgi:uncharacterized protein (TIGR01777 family)